MFSRMKKNEKNRTSLELIISTIKTQAPAEAPGRDGIITIIPEAVIPDSIIIIIMRAAGKDLTSKIYSPTFLTGQEKNKDRREETI